jgi:5-formyltetrahydrofolate cyclo-ligase
LKNKLIIEPIAFYFSDNFEVDTRLIIDYLLKKKKKICVPRTINEKEMNFFYINNLKKDLEMNQKFNFLQPKLNCKKIKPELIKTIFVPIIAYDSKNNRLGQGKGYYDYFLKNLKNIFKIGLAYKIQKIKEEIKFDDFDIKMDLIITN